jgi:TatD DNase family protein
MNKISFINIHTHSPAQPGEWVIQNIHRQYHQIPASFFSAGLHPWYISKDLWKSGLSALKDAALNINMAALGECGLDKVCNTDYTLQKEVFTAQVNLANQIKKPLIIHCVRAYEDVMHLLEEQQNRVPVIFHGFNKSLTLAEKLIAKGYYLSFGKAIERPHMQPIFAAISMNRIFLETDDAEISIGSIYKTAAGLHNISIEELNLQLKQNVHTVFNISV